MDSRTYKTLLLAGLLTTVHCAQEARTPPRLLSSALPWYGDNAARLNDFIAQYGTAGPNYVAEQKPVAMFDWDNTTIKNDIGDALFFHMINTDKILQPPFRNWRMTSPYLTTDAASALTAACDGLASPGEPLPTASNAACANELYSIYDSEKTSTGKPAFAGYNYRRMEPAYAWAVQLTAGYTPDQIRAFTETVIMQTTASPIGTTQTVGTHADVSGYIRVYDQIQDLIGTMQDNGFDVWVTTASSQQAVETFAARIGVAADHVIGVRLVVDKSGKLTYNLEGCGDVPQGTNDGIGHFTGNSMLTYIDGKRCWANKVIWGDNSAGAVNQNPDPGQRQVFAAGDSNTDISFVRDATVLKLVINRNKKELMCNAYANFGDKYLVNPMFIAPKSQLVGGYPCSTTACVNDKGAAVPCYDEATPPMQIPDQQDKVFAM